MRVKLAVKYHETRAPGRDSPALVILHGLFGSANNWRRLAQQLSSDYPVHALDLRNHGASPHHPHMTYANMAGDVAGYLDHALTRPPVLIGHSMGEKPPCDLPWLKAIVWPDSSWWISHRSPIGTTSITCSMR